MSTNESQNLHRIVLNALGDGVHVIDNQLNIILANPAFEAWMAELGLVGNLVGKRVEDAFPFLDESVFDEYRRVFETGEVIVSRDSYEVGGREVVT
ncbi:MAG: PAS domain-containing protein, partial [candidate division Zixibacteria bacterium]|nr:PAS domain-containing protein [candidate division Zixibacteria bacterium]